MKLLFCPKCHDVFKLTTDTLRQCECGHVKGRYKDNIYAEHNGNGVDIAIGNGSLLQAVKLITGFSADRGFYPVMCWARQASPEANPHVVINKGL